MLSRKFRLYSVGRSVALVTVAALALTAIEPSMALAGAATAAQRASVAAYQGPTDVSARRKAVRYRGFEPESAEEPAPAPASARPSDQGAA